LLVSACANQAKPAPVIALDPPASTLKPPKAAPATAGPVKPPPPAQALSVMASSSAPKPTLARSRPDPADPRQRIRRADAAARMQPDRFGFINAMQVWPFSAGALYQVYTSPQKVTDIALQPGEKLISVSAGDTTRWVIGDTRSGAGVQAQVHVLVKPIRPDLKTNLLIYTDRRSYHLELTAGPTAWLASISWDYPQDALLALHAPASDADPAADAYAAPVATGLSLDRLRFRYKITGDNPAWRPSLAFDDGTKVYIQFPAAIATTQMPPLLVISDKGRAELVNYRVRGPYYVVDGLFGAAELRLGEKPQSVVRIERTDGTKAR
jgi:type IV secretion system protein VirB9